MDRKRRIAKENNIVKAAEAIFEKSGFNNSKMDEIASAAGITKVTLYTYFQSKENLYMAVTYKAFQYLIEVFYETIEEFKSKSGIEGVIGIQEAFIQFCETNFLYSEVILNYFSLIRSSKGGKDSEKMTPGINESIYFTKIKDIQNLPLKLTSQEIERGKADGSIKSKVDSVLLTLQGWSMIVGYTKLISSSGMRKTLLNVDLKDIRRLNSEVTRTILSKGF